MGNTQILLIARFNSQSTVFIDTTLTTTERVLDMMETRAIN